MHEHRSMHANKKKYVSIIRLTYIYLFIVAHPGFSIHAYFYSGKAGTTSIDTEKEFMEPICLSLWYQFYRNTVDCVFSIYKITGVNQTLLFTVKDNVTLFTKWVYISVNVHGQDLFKIALMADCKERFSKAVRVILIDDTSIAYRPCEGKCEVESIDTK